MAVMAKVDRRRWAPDLHRHSARAQLILLVPLCTLLAVLVQAPWGVFPALHKGIATRAPQKSFGAVSCNFVLKHRGQCCRHVTVDALERCISVSGGTYEAPGTVVVAPQPQQKSPANPPAAIAAGQPHRDRHRIYARSTV